MIDFSLSREVDLKVVAGRFFFAAGGAAIAEGRTGAAGIIMFFGGQEGVPAPIALPLKCRD